MKLHFAYKLTDSWLHDFYNDAANAPPLQYFANCKSVERAVSTAYIQLILVKGLAVRILDVCRGTLQGCSLIKERSNRLER